MCNLQYKDDTREPIVQNLQYKEDTREPSMQFAAER